MTGAAVVLKVQLPLALTPEEAESENLALIYNEDKSWLKQVPITNYLLSLMERPGGYALKRYFEAWVDGDSVVMGSQVEDPGW